MNHCLKFFKLKLLFYDLKVGFPSTWNRWVKPNKKILIYHMNRISSWAYRQNYNLNTACQCRKNTHRVQFLLIFIRIGSGPTENSIRSELTEKKKNHQVVLPIWVDLCHGIRHGNGYDMWRDIGPRGGKVNWKS